jgi:hypothetical protein
LTVRVASGIEAARLILTAAIDAATQKRVVNIEARLAVEPNGTKRLLFTIETITGALSFEEAAMLVNALVGSVDHAPTPLAAATAGNLARFIRDVLAQAETMSVYGPH